MPSSDVHKHLQTCYTHISAGTHIIYKVNTSLKKVQDTNTQVFLNVSHSYTLILFIYKIIHRNMSNYSKSSKTFHDIVFDSSESFQTK